MTQDLARAIARTKVREARTAAGLTQQTLASKAGVSLGTLMRIERGDDTTLRTLSQIAAALNVSVAELIDEAAA
jgi:transcriptional regulator with XRE-family HTH domain